MDYYKRKALTINLIKKMLNNDNTDQEIVLAVEDVYQMSPLYVKKYLSRVRGEE